MVEIIDGNSIRITTETETISIKFETTNRINITETSNKTSNQLLIEALENELFPKLTKPVIEANRYGSFILKENDWVINTVTGDCNKVKSIERERDIVRFYIPDCFSSSTGILSFWENTYRDKGGVVRYATESEILNTLKKRIDNL